LRVYIDNIKKWAIKTTKTNRNILLNVLGAFFFKGGCALIQLLIMPAYMRYFDNQILLGLWFTVVNLLSWIFYFDLGISNGLRNHLTIAFAKNDEIQAKKYISSAYIAIGIFTALICISSIIVFRTINWNGVFNVSTELISAQLLLKVVLLVTIGIFINLFLRVILSVFYALQFSMGTNILAFLQNSVLLSYLLIAKPSNIETNIIVLACVNVFCMNFPLLAATVVIFSGKLKKIRPSIKFFDKTCTKEVVQLGGLFFLIQIMSMAIISTNDFFISFFTSPKYVVEYQIYNKLFWSIDTLFMLALSPIWSAVTKAIVQNNFSWLRKMNKFIMLFALLGIAFEFLLIPVLQVVCDFWLKDNSIKINFNYAFLFAILSSLILWNGAIGVIANGAGVVKAQIIALCTGFVLKIPLIIIFLQVWDSWLAIVASTIVAFIPNCFVLPFAIKRYLNKN
jgi:hypothetical protein